MTAGSHGDAGSGLGRSEFDGSAGIEERSTMFYRLIFGVRGPAERSTGLRGDWAFRIINEAWKTGPLNKTFPLHRANGETYKPLHLRLVGGGSRYAMGRRGWFAECSRPIDKAA